jgi:hypothetical protein
MTLRYGSDKYFEEYLEHPNVEGQHFPYLCQKCNKFVSKKQCDRCWNVDWIVVDNTSYEILCARCWE